MQKILPRVSQEYAVREILDTPQPLKRALCPEYSVPGTPQYHAQSTAAPTYHVTAAGDGRQKQKETRQLVSKVSRLVEHPPTTAVAVRPRSVHSLVASAAMLAMKPPGGSHSYTQALFHV